MDQDFLDTHLHFSGVHLDASDFSDSASPGVGGGLCGGGCVCVCVCMCVATVIP